MPQEQHHQELDHAPLGTSASVRLDERSEQILEFAISIFPGFINKRTKVVNISGLIKKILEDWFWFRHRTGGKTTLMMWEVYQNRELIKAWMRGDERDPDEILAELDYDEFVANHSAWRKVGNGSDDNDSDAPTV